MRNTKRMSIVAGLVMALALTMGVRAEPFNPEHVASDARWYVHVDLQTMRDSELGQYLIEKKADEDHDRRMAWVERHTSIRPDEDLTGLLIFDTDFQKHQGVAVLQGNLDRDRIVDRLAESDDYELVDEASDVHQVGFRHEGERKTLLVSFADDQLIISSDRDRLASARAVLQQEAEGLAEDSPLLAPAREGTLIQFGAVELSRIPERHAHLARSAERLALSLAEADGQTWLHAELTANDGETAEQLEEAIRGLIAIAQLREKAAAPLLEAVEVNRAGEQIELQWSYATDDVIETLDAHDHRHDHDHGRAH